MYKCANGWTKTRMIEQVLTKGKNEVCAVEFECRYRQDENACAIGRFIPDELYVNDMEGYSVLKLLEHFPQLKLHMPFDDDNALLSFQSVHDTFHLFSDFHKDKSLNIELMNCIQRNVED